MLPNKYRRQYQFEILLLYHPKDNMAKLCYAIVAAGACVIVIGAVVVNNGQLPAAATV